VVLADVFVHFPRCASSQSRISSPPPIIFFCDHDLLEGPGLGEVYRVDGPGLGDRDRLNGPGFVDPAGGDGLGEDAFDFLANGGEFILLDKFTREYGEYKKNSCY
jgi:hypothetical protein